MPSKIDHNLLPAQIRESVDPEILARAQSIEWSINRDTGENEHGYLDGSHEDYLSSQNLMHKTHNLDKIQAAQRAKLQWMENNHGSSQGRDSGFEYTPTSPSLNNQLTKGKQQMMGSYSSLGGRVDLSPLEESLDNLEAPTYNTNTGSKGSMKRHPQGQYPFPIYKVNQEQLEGDVVFEVAPRARPGERTVHYEKSSRIMNEQEMEALDLDPNVFGPNTRTTMDEQEEELIETSVLKGGPRELEQIYNSMRTDAGDYFDRQRARSVSPTGNRLALEDENSSQKRTVIFGSVDEIDADREQEFYPYRDAHQGKPLPGDNEYGTWGSRFDDKKEWKLCNGKWVRVAEPKPKPPQMEKYMAERVKCKPPKKVQVARAEPIRKIRPQSGSTDSDEIDSDTDADLDLDNAPVDLDSPLVEAASPLVDRSNSRRSRSSPPAACRFRASQPQEQPVDIEALKDRYRPKKADRSSPVKENTKLLPDNTNKQPTGTILLEPIRPPTPPLEEIKVEPKQHTYVRMKKPLKSEGEEEKMMEDPNLMWMRMGPAQYGPPFGSLRRRKAREEEWVGPPCELCHKQIEERRCMLAENMKFHCWHFACSFCLKTLKPSDFLIAEADRKPYCLNCHKREFPEISLTNLNLEAEE